MKEKTFGCNSTTQTTKSFKRLFPTELDYDSECFYTSKETFRHEEEGLTFDYKYVVWLEDMEALSGEEDCKGQVSIALYLVPTIECLSEEIRKKVRESCGLEESDKLDLADVVMYGYGIRMAYEFLDNCRSMYGTKVRNKLNAVATLLDTINSFRGFYLDGNQNLIGTTGWDELREMLFNESAVDATLERHKKQA